MNTRFFHSYIIVLIALLCSCRPEVPASFSESKLPPSIYPDYAGVSIPANIAPLNFMIDNPATSYITRFSYNGGEWVTEGQKVQIDEDVWEEMKKTSVNHHIKVEVFLKEDDGWKMMVPFHYYVKPEPIDPYLSYRLISPSYVTYMDLTINQRNLTSFEENIIYGNMMNTNIKKGQCINCHSYQNYNPDRLQFHVREGMGGTVIAHDGKLKKVNLKADSVLSAGVYPSWHPTKKLIAYSVNNTGQTFHTIGHNKVEVQDYGSNLILYNIEKNEVTPIKGDDNELECFPWWSPDGKYVYYVSAHYEPTDSNLQKDFIVNYEKIKYNIYRRAYNEASETLEDAELVFNADSLGKSATLPRISPDGKYLMFTLGNYGVFHIWHKDADLYLMDLATRKVRRMNTLNSRDVESYHSWSSNGRWVVFSSRRYDGNFTRPYIAYIDADGKEYKPFELPQEDPEFHRLFMRSYNIPEFMSGPVKISAQDFARLIRGYEAEKATLRK